MYDDRLDEKISSDFWQKKQKEITDEQLGMLEQIKKIKSDEARYFEIWLNIIDLARRSAEIYAKRSPEEKRLLLSCLFSNLTLKDKKVIYTFKKPVAVLAQRVQEKIDAENIFEPEKTLVTKGLKGDSEPKLTGLLDMVREIGTFWKHNKELIWLPNIKQGFFGITQPTAEEMAKYK